MAASSRNCLGASTPQAGTQDCRRATAGVAKEVASHVTASSKSLAMACSSFAVVMHFAVGLAVLSAVAM